MNESLNEKDVNSGKHSKRKSQSRAKLKSLVLSYWDTNISLFTIAKKVGCRQPTVKSIFVEKYGIDELNSRKSRLYKAVAHLKLHAILRRCRGHSEKK